MKYMGALRTAVIGMGNMGSQYAAFLLAGRIPGMELCAVTRVRPKRLETLGLVLPESLPVYPGADALFEALDTGKLCLDAVIIATPHRMHEAQSIAAMKRGLHVLCDKPAGIYSRQARLMEEARAEDLICAWIFHQRTYPAYRQIRQIVQSQTLGGLKRVSWTATDWYRSNAYYQSSSWRGTWKLDGGGTLLNQCPHNLDLLQWICGMPARTRAFCHNGRYHPIEVEDDVTAYLEWENGATGVFIASTGEAPGVNRLEITLDDGLIICQPEGVRVCRLDRPEKEYRVTLGDDFQMPSCACETLPMEINPDPYVSILTNFASAVMRKDPRELTAPWEEARKSLLMSNAIYLSSWTDRTVDIPLPGSEEEKAFEKEFETHWRAI